MAISHDLEADEAWESDSVKTVQDCTSDESDLDADTARSFIPPPAVINAEPVRQFEPPPPSEGVTEKKKNIPQTFQMDSVHTSPMRAPLPAVQVRSVQTSAAQLATHLKKDNERLKQLVLEAQREAEKALERDQGKGNVDFAHLLELVKDCDTSFGEDHDRGDEPEVCMSFNTQEFRMDNDDVDEKIMKIKRLKFELAQLKNEMAVQQSSIKPALTKIDEPISVEPFGCWVSSKTGKLQHVVPSDAVKALTVPNAIVWQMIEAHKESALLLSHDGIEHTVEQIKTKMFGESLLWRSGELWTRKSA